MKFVISRTSSYGDDSIKPCEEAFKDEILNVDIRTISDPSQFKNKTLECNWYKQGSNHRLINGRIARDMDMVEEWFIEINTLEELLKFKDKYGDIILETSSIDKKTHEIVIYDDYID